jgi:hypothetical protein
MSDNLLSLARDCGAETGAETWTKFHLPEHLAAFAERIRAEERERAALLCDDLAWFMENGAGDPEPGGRLRQAARNIRDPNDKPMNLDKFAAAIRGDSGDRK